MVAQAKTHLDEEVAAGEHTQEEADQKLADITERITDSVNNGMPARGDHGPGGGRPAGRRRHRHHRRADPRPALDSVGHVRHAARRADRVPPPGPTMARPSLGSGHGASAGHQRRRDPRSRSPRPGRGPGRRRPRGRGGRSRLRRQRHRRLDRPLRPVEPPAGAAGRAAGPPGHRGLGPRRPARHVRAGRRCSAASVASSTPWCRASTPGPTPAGSSCTRAPSAPPSPPRTSVSGPWP